MPVCPRCNVKHDENEEFCKECGSFLLPIDDSASQEKKPKVSFLCPRCQVLYKNGSYCPTCGSLLMRQMAYLEAGLPLEKKSVRKRSIEWLRLLKKEEELESCVSKLETHRDKISGDVLNSLSLRYKEKLESLLPFHQRMEAELDSVKKRASEVIDDLEKELKPIQERLEEFRSLNQSGAVTRPDFLREKKELKKKIKSRQKSLKGYRQILSLLPEKMGGTIHSPGFSAHLFRPLPVLVAGTLVTLMAIAGYLLWSQQTYSKNRQFPEKEMVASPLTTPSINSPPVVTNEMEKIGSVFENIKQANLSKDIDLFVSCFSRDFDGMEGKRRDTLKMWENYNYLSLSYHLTKQTISGDMANITLEWLVRTSQKTGGKPQEGRTVLDVTLKREEGLWKIKEIKSLS